MGLSAATALGDNVVAMFDAVARRTEIVARPTALASSMEARRGLGEHDVIWACGYLTAAMVRAGELDADVVAAPVFTGEDAAVYRSVVVARPDTVDSLDKAGGARLAINEFESWSGHLALRAQGVDTDGFAEVIMTGSHRASVAAVAEGRADLASIDETVWRSLDGDGLVVIDTTRDWPAPPIAVHRRVDDDDRRAVVDALLSIRPGDVPGVDRFTLTDVDAYDEMLA